MKIRKLITISKKIFNEINRKVAEDGFNFSGWVEKIFIKEFMAKEGIKLQLDFHKKQIKKLNGQLNGNRKTNN